MSRPRINVTFGTYIINIIQNNVIAFSTKKQRKKEKNKKDNYIAQNPLSAPKGIPPKICPVPLHKKAKEEMKEFRKMPFKKMPPAISCDSSKNRRAAGHKDK